MAILTYNKKFKPEPYWWDDYRPHSTAVTDLPPRIRVLIVGAGCTGLCAALELNRAGYDCLVVDAGDPGSGASTQHTGIVSPDINLSASRRFGTPLNFEQTWSLFQESAASFDFIEGLVARETIECNWTPATHIIGAHSHAEYESFRHLVDLMNTDTTVKSRILPPVKNGHLLGGDHYYGGFLLEKSAQIHPALFYKGLLQAVQKRDIVVCGQTPVLSMVQDGTGWRVKTARGDIVADSVLIATNAMTGPATPALQKRIMPMHTFAVATSPLAPEYIAEICPKGASFSDHRRISSSCRPSPDGTRLIFSTNGIWGNQTPTHEAIFHYYEMERRILKTTEFEITHAWSSSIGLTFDGLAHMGKLDNIYYALGCNGKGFSLLSYFGHRTAQKIINNDAKTSAFDTDSFPTKFWYNGNPWMLPTIRRLNWASRIYNRTFGRI